MVALALEVAPATVPAAEEAEPVLEEQHGAGAQRLDLRAARGARALGQARTGGLGRGLLGHEGVGLRFGRPPVNLARV